MSQPLRLHRTVPVKVGHVQVGGGAPVVIQSMTMTETADAVATARRVGRTVGVADVDAWADRIRAACADPGTGSTTEIGDRLAAAVAI